MSFGMKHWLGLLAFGIALVSLETLPPAPPPQVERRAEWPEEARLKEIHDELGMKQETLRRMRWSDSLSALVLATSVEGVAVAYPDWEEPGAESFQRLRSAIEAERQGLATRADMTFAYVYQDREHGRLTRLQFTSIASEFYVGSRADEAYCIKVRKVGIERAGHLLPATAEADGRPGNTNYLGACRPFIEHGLPGPHVMAWLEQGALEYGVDPAPAPKLSRPLKPRLDPFGLRRRGEAPRNLAIERCLAGAPEGCLDAFTSPRYARWRYPETRELVARSPMTGYDDSERRDYFGVRDDHLLADMEAAFGPEAFRRFWTSEREVPEAFQEAFGVEMGAWISTWLDIPGMRSAPGPGLGRSAGLGGILAMSLFAVVAGAWSRRRRVG